MALWIKVHWRTVVSNSGTVRLKQIAKLTGDEPLVKRAESLVVGTLDEARTALFIDGIHIIRALEQQGIEGIEWIGPTYTYVKRAERWTMWQTFSCLIVSLLLFIGSFVTIINFHQDVDMPKTHAFILKLLGQPHTHRLWLEIPYSLGLTVGMVLFFNHLFQRRLFREPSPLDIELYQYEQAVQDVTAYERLERRE